MNLKLSTYQHIFLVAQAICHTLTNHQSYSCARPTNWQSPLKIEWQNLLINAMKGLCVLKEDCG